MNPATTRRLAALVVLCLGVSAVGLPIVAPPAAVASAGPSSVDSKAADVTYVEDDVTEDTTWTSEGGPYRIAADVTVEEGATLRVEPGTTIQPAADITITVEGNLTAAGTEADPITVSTAPGAPDDVRWASIRYAGTAHSHLSLSHVTIENATNAITVASPDGRIDLSAVTVRNVGRNGVRVVTDADTPKVVVEDSTFAEVGARGVAVTPGTGAVGESRVTSNSSEPRNWTEHQLAVTPGADTTMDAFRVGYRGHGKVGVVNRSSFRYFGLDLNDNGTVDRSLLHLVANVTHPHSNSFEIELEEDVTIPADATIRVAYEGVVNPGTYGTYPVEVGFRTNGVPQTATTVVPFDLRSDGYDPVRDPGTSRASRFTVRDSTFESVGQQGVFVAADVSRRFRVTGNSFADVRGSAVAIRGPQVDSVVVAGNRIARVGEGADGVRVAAQRAVGVDLRGNRISGADAGVGFYLRDANADAIRLDSNVVTGSTTGVRVRHEAGQLPQHVSMTVADNRVANNAERGFSVVAPSTRLDGLAVRGNAIAGNGGAGLFLDGNVLAELAVRNNTVTANGNGGVRFTGGQFVHSSVRNNTLAENRGDGFSARTRILVHDVTVAENRVLDNAGVGIDVDNQLTHAGAVTLSRNLVAANAYGIRVSGAFGARVVDNTVVYNTYGLDAPVRLDDYRPGTGIVVEEGDAGAIFHTPDVSEALVELIDDPEVERKLRGQPSDDYTVVLRPGREGDVWTGDRGALTVRSLSEDIPTGVVLRKGDEGRRGVVVRGNDVYGHRRGMTVNVSTLVDANTTTRLFVNATRTVSAERNYWGAETGPTHSSIHPEGTGDRVATRRGWVDFIPPASSPHGPRYHRPVANVTVSPNPAVVNESVALSGAASSDGDGRVAFYRFVVRPDRDGTTPTVLDSGSAEVTRSFETPGRYAVSLVVEDELGVESATAATANVSVREASAMATPTTTSAPTETGEQASNETATPTTTTPTKARSGFLPGLAVFTSLGGLLGLVFYGAGLLLGAYAALQSFQRAGVSVSGVTINGLAVAGVGVWVVSGLLGTDGLLGVGLGGAMLWVGLVVLLWAATRLVYD